MLRSSDNLMWHVEFGYNNGVFLFTAENLLQNGGITSGNDTIFMVFWPLHGTAKNLVMMFMDKKVNRCFRNSLAACNAFASEFGRFGATLFFLDVHDGFSTTTNQLVFLPNCVLHFLEAA